MRNRQPRFGKLWLMVLLLFGGGAAFGQQGAYTVPAAVYVGDRAALILPLLGFTGTGDTEINPEQIPSSPELIIHRAAVERRPAGNFLTIEFSAYMPGILQLPPLTIAGKTFDGLSVEISSILVPDESGTVLSGPAQPLAIPGTSLLVYGAVSLIILVMLLISWALLWGRKRMKGWMAAWKRKRLIAAMRRIERRLRKALIRGSGRREILDELTAEFRSFLAYLTGKQCRAMTAAEFSLLGNGEGGGPVPAAAALGVFFARCDSIRFSGGDINGNDVMSILDDLRSFLLEPSSLDSSPAESSPSELSPAGQVA